MNMIRGHKQRFAVVRKLQLRPFRNVVAAGEWWRVVLTHIEGCEWGLVIVPNVVKQDG